MATFYDEYISKVTNDDERTRVSVDATLAQIDSLLASRGLAEKRISGLVVGRVQSGKTRNYIGLTLRAIDAGWNVILFLTSAIKALADQTHGRIVEDYKHAGINASRCHRLNFLDPVQNDEPSVLDDPNTPFFYWGVAMKEKASLDRVRAWFDENASYADKMRILVIDDEADNATPDSNANKQPPMTEDQVADEVDTIRTCDDDDFSSLADWFETLQTLEMPDDAAKTAEAATFQKLTRALQKSESPKSVMLAILNDTGFQKILGMVPDTPRNIWEEPLDSLALRYFGGKKERSPSMFVKLLRSILEIAKGRSAINNAIVSLVDRIGDSPDYTYPFKACAYIGYTATPYACILNERPDQTPLYADFIASIEKSPQYFGLDAIYGSDIKTTVANMDIVRSITADEQRHVLYPIEGVKERVKGVKKPVLHQVVVNSDLSYVFDGKTKGEWRSLRTAVAWAFCTAAARRWYRLNIGDPAIRAKGYGPKELEKKLESVELRWTTMLFNISQKQKVHKQTQQYLIDYIKGRLANAASVQAFKAECQQLWDTETKRFGKKEFDKLFNSAKDPTEHYGQIGNACTWAQIAPHVDYFLKASNHHVIVINCGNKDDQDLYNQVSGVKLREDHLWFVCGGNTISRGLTLAGLTASYFDRVRKSVAVDTMTQMARWFGYRFGYELMPRIWMTPESVTEMKRTAIVEDRMHQGIRENFAAGFSPSDEAHYQPIYSFGRRLSGRARAQRNESVGVGTYGSTDDISVVQKDVAAVVARTRRFLGDLAAYAPMPADEARRAKECPYGKTPLWANVPVKEVVSFLQDVRMSYPEKSRRTLEGLLQEINRTDSTDWDVVIGEPGKGGVEYDIGGPRKYRSGQQTSAIVVGDVAHFSAARLHLPYYAAIPASAINEVDFEVFRSEYVAKIIPGIEHEMATHGGKLPAELASDLAPYPGKTLRDRFKALLDDLDKPPYAKPVPGSIHGRFHGSLEGFRNRSSSVYMEKVHAKAKHSRPTLQIYLLKPPSGVVTGGLPLVSLACYWPKHEPDIFHAVSVGLQPKVPTISRRKFFETVTDVLEDYDFLMPANTLKASVLNRLGPSCPESFFEKNIAHPPEGYGYVRVKKRNAYMPKGWAKDVEKKLDGALLEAAIHLLQVDGKPHKVSDLYVDVLRKNPKLGEFFLAAGSNDRARFTALFMPTTLAQNKLVKISGKPITFQYKSI